MSVCPYLEIDMILCMKDPKVPSENICKLQTLNVFDKAVECKFSIDKSVAFLYTNNKVSKQKILEEKSHS